ncbi:MAG TPA: SGNH/GDSL hydrolase family protein [Pilimelia sp.]|nr:SGNH/GDSL hydrolase family protein [Pilimelia sp.]
MRPLSRIPLALVLVCGAATGLLSPPATARATPASLPTAAVAIGDSFVSGEGAGAYQPVMDANGVRQHFPGWSADNGNAFFCHRSANASLHQADLPGIQARINLACSGAQPHDIVNASASRPKGRLVPSQLQQLRTVAQSHDIDLVLVGIGSNNSHFTFGNATSTCVNQFIADAWTGWWEFWALLNGPVKQAPCTTSDLATPAALDAAAAETTAAARQLLRTLAEVDADGRHRVVFQDYTNPLPLDYHPVYHTEDGRDDSRDKFRALGAERYAGGCPAHRASLAAGHWFSDRLGGMVQAVRTTLAAEFPAADLVYLNVQHAFDGARLCETAAGPGAALATPIRLQDGPTGVVVTDLSGYDKFAIQRLGNTCLSYYQTCQESWHPTRAGHAVLGRCLTAAATTAARTVTCARSPEGSIAIG